MAKEETYDEGERKAKFRIGMKKWLAIADHDVTHTVDGQPLFCPECFMYIGTTRKTHPGVCKGVLNTEVFE